LFLYILTVVPLLTEIPLHTGEVMPEPDNVLMVFEYTLVVDAPVMLIPTTVDDAPDEESVFIELPLIFMTVDVLEHVIPDTVPPVPVEDKLFIVFVDIVNGLPLFPDEPIFIPVIAPWPVIFVTVLLESVEVVLPK